MTQENQPLFQVLRNGKPIMSTNYESCIYDKKTIRALKEAGYTIIDCRKKVKKKDDLSHTKG